MICENYMKFKSINKVYWRLVMPVHLCVDHGCFYQTMEALSRRNRDCMARKAWSMCSLVLAEDVS